MLKSWLKIFLFNFKKNKLFPILTVIGLSIGITGVLLSSMYWKEERSFDQWNPDKDKIFEVLTNMGNKGIWSSNVGPLGNAIAMESDQVEEYFYYYNWPFTNAYLINGQNKTIDVNFVQENFFHFFPFETIKGSAKAFEAHKKTIALAEETAFALFGKENPIGKIITNEEKESFTITTVYKLKDNSSFTPKAVINDFNVDETDWNNFNYQLLLKIKDPTTIASVSKVVNRIVQKNLIENYAQKRGISVDQYIEKYGNIEPILTKLTDARLYNINSGLPNKGGNIKFLLINVGISLLILFLSMVNQINLATAYVIKRVKEFGTKRVIGASKKDIILQVVFETSIYVFSSIVIALALVELLLPYYNSLLHHHLQLNILHDLPFIGLVAISMIVIAGLFPALYVSHLQIIDTLKGKFSYSIAGNWLRNGLLTVQFVIAFIFICVGYNVYQQIQFMMHQNKGFKGDQVIAVSYYNWEKPNRFAFYLQTLEKLKQIPGVKEVAGSNMTIGFGSPQSSPILFKDQHVQSRITYTEFDLLQLLSAEFIAGRDFDKNINSDTINNVVINETLMKELGIAQPINQSIKWNAEYYNIIGVIKDMHVTGYEMATPPSFYIRGGNNNYVRNNLQNIFIKITADDTQQTLKHIEKLWNTQVDDHYPFEYEFIDKQFARTYENHLKQRNLFGILNIVVIAIGLFGLYALASFSIERRYKEIAIKKVLGADSFQLMKDLSKQYVLICILGFVLAIIPSMYLINAWLGNFAYRIEVSYSTYVIAFVIMTLLTLTIVIGKAYTAIKQNPLRNLKYE